MILLLKILSSVLEALYLVWFLAILLGTVSLSDRISEFLAAVGITIPFVVVIFATLYFIWT